MQITAQMVKELRERTGAGMMDCKKALQESAGDIEKAIEEMRKSGVAKAAKKAGRIAAEGNIIIRQNSDTQESVILEINSETDFVAKDDSFRAFCNDVADCILDKHPDTVEVLLNTPIKDNSGQTVEETRQQLVGKIGENISVRRFELIEGKMGTYLHGTRIGVLVNMDGGDEVLARDIAMHVAASKPVYVSADDVPQELLEKEKEIFIAQAQDSGKPPEIIEKMIDGRLVKFLKEITLLGQPFVKDPNQEVGKLLDNAGATVKGFIRYEVSEGL